MKTILEMSKNYFTHQELCLYDNDIPDHVKRKLDHHISQMNPVRDKLGAWITASEESGYRPVWHEKKRGRSGTSQHCFIGMGAVDWTCAPSKIKALLKLIIEMTDYTRICYYPKNNFIHCDYKAKDGKRYYFECSSTTSKWGFKKLV